MSGSGVSWTSGFGSASPGAARISFAFYSPTAVACIKILQHADSFCPEVTVQSSHKFAWSWWPQAVLVKVDDTDKTDVIVQRLVTKPACNVTGLAAPCAVSEPTFEEFSVWHGCVITTCAACGIFVLIAVFVMLIGSVVVVFGHIFSFEAWFDIEALENPKRTEPRSIGAFSYEASAKVFAERDVDATVSDRFFRIKIVCHPSWFLETQDLGSVIQQSCLELKVVREPQASTIFPSLAPLRDYEAVVQVPQHVSNEDIGRMLMTLLEKRRRRANSQVPVGPRLPRFQTIAYTRWGFLYFGGKSLSCGHRRFRSCPSRTTYPAETVHHAHDD